MTKRKNIETTSTQIESITNKTYVLNEENYAICYIFYTKECVSRNFSVPTFCKSCGPISG